MDKSIEDLYSESIQSRAHHMTADEAAFVWNEVHRVGQENDYLEKLIWLSNRLEEEVWREGGRCLVCGEYNGVGCEDC